MEFFQITKKKELAVVLSNLGKNIKIGYLHVSMQQ